MTTLAALAAVLWTVYSVMAGLAKGDYPAWALLIGSVLWLLAGAALHAWCVS